MSMSEWSEARYGKKTSFRRNADAGFSCIKDEIQDCTSEGK